MSVHQLKNPQDSKLSERAPRLLQWENWCYFQSRGILWFSDAATSWLTCLLLGSQLCVRKTEQVLVLLVHEGSSALSSRSGSLWPSGGHTNVFLAVRWPAVSWSWPRGSTKVLQEFYNLWCILCPTIKIWISWVSQSLFYIFVLYRILFCPLLKCLQSPDLDSVRSWSCKNHSVLYSRCQILCSYRIQCFLSSPLQPFLLPSFIPPFFFCFSGCLVAWDRLMIVSRCESSLIHLCTIGSSSWSWAVFFLSQAGNVVTGEMVEELILSGADIIKVGVGPGKTCQKNSRGCVCGRNGVWG